MIYKTQSLIIMIYTNTIPNNEIIPNLNKPKAFAPANYWCILNKNAAKIHKNIGAAKYIQKKKAHPKTLADAKTLANPKTLADAKTLADRI
jgi:hypothetical protein